MHNKKHILNRWVVAGLSVTALLGAPGAAALANTTAGNDGYAHHVRQHEHHWHHHEWVGRQQGDQSQQGQNQNQQGQDRQGQNQGQDQNQQGQSADPGSLGQGNSTPTSSPTDGASGNNIGAGASGQNTNTGASASGNLNTTSTALPPGVWHYDASVNPIAGLNATWQQKFDAVLSVAKSKLGTPYRWGHNEDRGQYGFDCSNFDEYVYHHALGYRFSGASRIQARSVGWTVPKSDMRPGDLLIFNNGGHCGIYIGNNEMIEEGGGLGKVGYLSVAPGSYWGRHLTAVKRMF